MSYNMMICYDIYDRFTMEHDFDDQFFFARDSKVHSRWIFSAKLFSRCKPAPPFLVIFTLS
jgi:hypothetical protein